MQILIFLWINKMSQLWGFLGLFGDNVKNDPSPIPQKPQKAPLPPPIIGARLSKEIETELV